MNIGQIIFRGLLVVIALLYLGCLVDAYAGDYKAEYEKRLILIERYPASCFPATENIMGPAILSDRILSVVQKKDTCFAPFIINLNESTALVDPRITITFPPSFKVAKKPALWQWDMDKDGLYFFAEGFGAVLNDTARGINEMIEIELPEPGRYKCRYTIAGMMNGIAVKTTGRFWIEVLPLQPQPAK